eukprot:11638-Pelagomonas_calceolata.AAC.1
MRANRDWEASTELCRPMSKRYTSRDLLHRATSGTTSAPNLPPAPTRAPACAAGQLQRPSA